MLYNRCTGIYKFGNNTYPWRIRRRSNLGQIFQGKKCILWARKYSNRRTGKSNYKVYAYIVKHNYRLGGMLFTICKAQLHVSATNVGHLQVV